MNHLKQPSDLEKWTLGQRFQQFDAFRAIVAAFLIAISAKCSQSNEYQTGFMN
jgi:hypothetical protein